MKPITVALTAFCLLWGCSSQVVIKGRSDPVIVLIRSPEPVPAKTSSLPAYLILVEKAFEEPSGNNVLDAEETGALVLQVRNDGLGPGKLSVRLTPLGDMEHLSFQRSVDAGLLAVQEARTIRIPIQADPDVIDGHREMRVEVGEDYTRAALPFTLSFDTRSLVVPKFRVIVRRYDDGRFYKGNTPDGLVQAGELVKVVANMQNVGGDAEGVEVAVETGGGGDIRYTRDLQGNTDNRFVLGKLVSGENRDIEFYFFTTPVFAAPKVALKVQVREARGRFGAEEELAFDIGKRVSTEEVVAVEASKDKGPPLSLVKADRIDIEEIPQGSKTRLEHGLAVIFGIEEYKYISFEAAYKGRDATTFFRYCREVLGIPEERIALRTDDRASKAEFDYIFEPRNTPNEGWLKNRLRDPQEAAQTDLFVYLAGHGFPDLTTGQPYLIPYDVRPEQAANGVSLNRLYQTLSGFGVRSVTIFVESCFSGASGYDRSGSERLLALNMNPVFPVIERPMIGSNMVVFSATSGKKPSNNRDDLKHGIFTYFVLKGLGGAADGDGDRKITVRELFRYVVREVPRKAYEPPLDREQVPELLPAVERVGEQGERVLVQY